MPGAAVRSRPSRSAQAGTVVLLTVSAAATAVLTRQSSDPGTGTLLLLILSLGGLGVVLIAPGLRRAVSAWLVVLLSALLLIVAVTFHPPHGSDLWVYAMYGRTVVDHGENPYVHPPSEFPEDPWLEDLFLFRDSRTFYGPLFTGMSVAIAAVGDDSRLVVRLGYQVGAALAVVASMLLLARAGASPASLALLGLNPVVIIDVVSQGRMDAYIGLGLLGAALLAGSRRPHLAVLAVAAAVLVKAPAVLAMGALVVWVWRHHDRRRAATTAAAGTGAIALGYLAAGGVVAVESLLDVRGQFNQINIWILARENGFALFLGDYRELLGPEGVTPTLALITTLLLGALLVTSRLSDRTPVLVLALPLLAYILTAVYPTARYAVWILPLLVLRPRSWPTAVTVALSSTIFLMVQYRAALLSNAGPDMDIGVYWLPDDRVFRVVHAAPVVLAIVGIVILATGAVGRLRQGLDPGGPADAAPQVTPGTT